MSCGGFKDSSMAKTNCLSKHTFLLRVEASAMFSTYFKTREDELTVAEG